MGSLVMYLILREDLSTKLRWPLGAIFTQIAHAATACVWKYREDENVLAYMRDADKCQMHKVTLKVEDEEQLKAEAAKLTEARVDYSVWIEDNMAVCIAVKPMEKYEIKPLLKHLPLYK